VNVNGDITDGLSSDSPHAPLLVPFLIVDFAFGFFFICVVFFFVCRLSAALFVLLPMKSHFFPFFFSSALFLAVVLSHSFVTHTTQDEGTDPRRGPREGGATVL